MTGTGDECVFASKGEEARIETDQIAFVLGHGRRQIVEPQFTGAAAEFLKGVNVTADEGFEALAVSEFQIHLAAVRFDQVEGVELASGAVI